MAEVDACFQQFSNRDHTVTPFLGLRSACANRREVLPLIPKQSGVRTRQCEF